MHLRQRRDEQRLGHEVAIRHRIERVLERAREPELVRDELRVEREAGPGERTRAERRHVDPLEAVAPAVEIPAERPEVREQMVREQHRLGALHVRVARQVHVGRFLGPPQEHGLELVDARRLHAALAAQEQSEVERDLVVAAAAGVQLGARRAGDLGDPALDRRVDVLVGGGERERARSSSSSTRLSAAAMTCRSCSSSRPTVSSMWTCARDPRDRRPRAAGRTAGSP